MASLAETHFAGMLRRDAAWRADLAACRATLAGGSRSFLLASRLLPGRVAGAAIALYAFCRVADDLIDRGGGSAALAALQGRLDAVYAGRPGEWAEDRALAAVVARHGLPRALLDALLEGFAWDAEGRRYDTYEDLLDYAARVAGAVGAMMAVLMGARAPHLVARACDLGTAMQLTNIARDVGEDARLGRLYLPRDWLAEAGIDAEAWLARPVFCPALGGVVARLLGEAEALYRRADAGIAGLPLDCRVGIGAARQLYAAIGVRVAAQGFDTVTRRAVVGGGRKLALLGRAAVASVVPVAADRSPALPSCATLVRAVPAPRPVALGFDARAAWLAELFSRLAVEER